MRVDSTHAPTAVYWLYAYYKTAARTAEDLMTAWTAWKRCAPQPVCEIRVRRQRRLTVDSLDQPSITWMEIFGPMRTQQSLLGIQNELAQRHERGPLWKTIDLHIEIFEEITE